MNRYKQYTPNIRGVSHALGAKGCTKADVRSLLAKLDGPCDCPCHTSGIREHDKGACKCRVVMRMR